MHELPYNPRGYYRTFLYRNYPKLYHDKVHLLTHFKVSEDRVRGVFNQKVFSYQGRFEQVLDSLAMDTAEEILPDKKTTLGNNSAGKDPGIGKVVLKCASEGRLVRVPGLQAKVGMLPQEKPNPFKSKVIRAFKENPSVNLDDYHHSSEKTGEATVSKLYKLATTKPCKEELEGDVKRFFCHVALAISMQSTYDGKGGILQNEPVPEDNIPLLKVKDASPGYMDPAFSAGMASRSKREEAVLAAMQIGISERARIVPLHVYKAAKKGEVIEKMSKPDKKGNVTPKAVRYIFGANTCEFLTFAASGLYEQMAEGKTTRDARLLPGDNGMYHDLIHCLSRSVRGDFATKEASLGGEVDSIDFKGWEYKVGLYCKVMYFLGITSTLRDVRYPYSLAGAIASVLCPIIGLDGEFAAICPDLLPSGTLPTLDLNNFVNVFITACFCLEQSEKFWPEVLDTIKMGDDMVSRKHQLINELKGFYEDRFGMEIAQVAENSFLQKTIDFKNQACVYPLDRMLNKIVHGPGTEEDKRQQLYSYYLMCNGHFEEFRVLKAIIGKPQVFAQKADGDMMGFYNEGLDDDVSVMQWHEPRDPNAVLVRFAFDDIHNSSEQLMNRRLDTSASRAVVKKRHSKLMRDG